MNNYYIMHNILTSFLYFILVFYIHIMVYLSAFLQILHKKNSRSAIVSAVYQQIKQMSLLEHVI